jgi:pimeloyl-ACP methyl ester carboxylesterase
MKIVDRGSGVPVVVVPGIQGRWEWMSPAVDALASRCRVITFSLADEPTSGATFDESAGIWRYVQQVADVLDAVGLEEATICGVSYAGVIAAAFAARHPHRVSSLVMMSAIPPRGGLTRLRFLMRSPRLLSPLFCIASARLLPEIIAAKGLLPGIGFAPRECQRARTLLATPDGAPRADGRHAGVEHSWRACIVRRSSWLGKTASIAWSR